MGTTSLEVGVYNSGTGQIDWLERNFYADVFNLAINDALGSGADTASFGMRFPVSYVEGGDELPLSGQILRITVEDVKLFQGIIEPIDQAWLGGGVSLDLSVSAVSEISLLNRHLVVKVYDAEETAGERIKRILQEFAPDFANDLSQIASATVVPAKTYDYQAVASTISEIARGVGYMWDLDYNKRILFFADMQNPAPIAAVDLDTDLTVGGVEVHTTPVEANVIIVKDFVSKSDNSYRHETAADGYSSFFKLPLEPFSIDDTDVFVRSGDAGTADWVQRTLIDDPLDGSPESIEGTEGLSYLCISNWGVRFPTSDMPLQFDGVRVDYDPAIPDRVTVVFDEDSIRECARREGGDGRHELVVSASDFRVRNENPIAALGHLILERKAWPVVTGGFLLRTTSMGEWAPGQTFTIESTKRDIFDVRQWVASNYTSKQPVRVWVTGVDRTFELHDTGIMEKNIVSFSSQPWQ